MKADWRRIEEVFLAALEQPAQEREGFISNACSGDEPLREEVVAMLRSHEETGDFLETPAYQQNAELLAGQSGALKIGEQIGDYRILALLGEGGMGEVYLAQDLSLGRKVAVKLIRPGFGGANLLRQFKREERILAGLTHPNIARLYGGAVTQNGVPYFVMELVEGERLDSFCDTRQLGIQERLDLFRKICAAVSYAHQHLVIHRDLKPANIRVGPDGEPKLLDFGIAKLLDDENIVVPEQTVTLSGAMTPDYASPEQLRGEPMTTATDVYSLGVILFELLTGEKPYRTKSRSISEVSRAITDQEPTRPSTAVARGQRSDVRNQKQLRGDLDNIVLTAIRKEPARRYSSVGQFSEDIRRHLEELPIVARKDTVGYRAGKFVRRNKIGVAAAALLFLSLLGGILATVHQARRAERRFNEVRRLANSLMFEIHDSVQDLEGSTPTRRLIVARALQYLDSLSSEGGGDAGLQRELATAYEKVGDIQGNPYTANLGDTDGALASYRKATAIRERLAQETPDTERTIELARSYRGIGDIMEQKGDVNACLENYRRSLSILERLAKEQPADPAVLIELARGHETLGDGLGRVEDNPGRAASYRASLKTRLNLLERTPTEARLQRSTGLSYMKLASVPGLERTEAIEDMKKAISMLEAVAAADPQNARARRDVGFAYYEAGRLFHDLGELEAALASRRKSLAIREQLAAQDPTNKQALFDLATAHGELSESLTTANAMTSGEAVNHAEQAVARMNDLAVADPGNAVYRRNVGLAYERLGEAQLVLANIDSAPRNARVTCAMLARTAFQKARDIFASLREEGKLMPSDSGSVDKFTARIADADSAIRSAAK